MSLDAKTVAADIMTSNARDVTPSEVWAHIGQAYDATDLPASFATEVVDLIGKTGIDLIWPDDTTNTELDAARVEIERLRAERDGERQAKQRLLDRLYAANPVLVAAQEWAEAHEERDVQLIRRRSAVPAVANLYDAVEEYRVMDAALDVGHGEQPTTTAEVNA